MAIVVPLRVTLAFVGLVSGYWAGVILEKAWIYNSSVSQLINTLGAIHTVGGFVDDCLTEDEIIFEDSVVTSSDEYTEYSEDAALGS